MAPHHRPAAGSPPGVSDRWRVGAPVEVDDVGLVADARVLSVCRGLVMSTITASTAMVVAPVASRVPMLTGHPPRRCVAAGVAGARADVGVRRAVPGGRSG